MQQMTVVTYFEILVLSLKKLQELELNYIRLLQYFFLCFSL